MLFNNTLDKISYLEDLMDFTRILLPMTFPMEVLGKIGKVYLRLLEKMGFCLYRPLVPVTLTHASVHGIARPPENAKAGSTTK